MRTTIAAALLGLLVASVTAQDRNNARGVGMARTANGTSLGIEALGINPSRLGLPDNRTMDIGLAPIGVQVRTQLFSYDIYNEFFTGIPGPGIDRVKRPLSKEDKDKILSLIPESAGTWATAEITPIALVVQNRTVGGIGFSMTEHVGVLARLSREFFKVAAFGLDTAGSLYNFSGTNFSAWWWRDYSVSYGREIPVRLPFVSKLYAGLTYKMIRGYGLFETLQFETTLGTVPTNVNQYLLQGNAAFHTRRAGVDLLQENSDEDATPFPEPAGVGSGFDLGFTADLRNNIQVSASIVNIGSIDWDKNIVETTGSGGISISNIFTTEGLDSLESKLRGENSVGEAFNSSLPTQLRFGVSMWSDRVTFLRWLPGRMLLGFDYTQGLNEAMGNTTKPRFSMGMEYRLIPLLPLRTGIAIGGDDSFRWSAGFGLDFHFLTMSFATENFGILFSPSNFQMAQFSFGLRIKV